LNQLWGGGGGAHILHLILIVSISDEISLIMNWFVDM